jgi:hypothetical protein
MTIKVYYTPCFFGFNYVYESMHPEQNKHVNESDYNVDNFKNEIKRILNTENIEFIEASGTLKDILLS